MKKMNYMYKLCGTALAVLFSVSVSSQIPFTKVETKNMMRKVADWQPIPIPAMNMMTCHGPTPSFMREWLTGPN